MTEQGSPSARQRSLDAGHALTDFLGQQAGRPGDGLIGSLVTAPPGARLSDDEIVTTAMLMLVAGHETSIGLVSAAIRHLLCDPAAARTLRQRPVAVPGAVAEIVRYDGPVTMTVRRIATADIRFQHAVIHAGDYVFLCLASANHDERRFPRAEQMVLERSPNPHLSFGHGIHRCPGAALGLLEARTALGALIRRTSSVSLAAPDSQLTWRDGKLRCLKHLPVHIEPAAPRHPAAG
jgi:cytochrome P450